MPPTLSFTGSELIPGTQGSITRLLHLSPTACNVKAIYEALEGKKHSTGLATDREGCISYFLYKVRVLVYNSSLCSYGQADKMPTHFLLYCPQGQGSSKALGSPRERTFLYLLDTPKGAERIAKWVY